MSLRVLHALAGSLRVCAASAAAPSTGSASALAERFAPRRDAHALSEAQTEALNITDACAKRLRQLLATENATAGGSSAEHRALRVAVDGGGCSGFQYRFELSDTAPEDRVFEHDGARVAVDPVSFGFLKGATVDYSEELIRASFVVKSNPQSASNCGCGSSFSAKT